MELRDLKDFYEKQTYYDYEETQNASTPSFEKRVSELSFFVNIALFSILLSLVTYLLMAFMPVFFAVPLAFVVALSVHLACRRAILRGLNNLFK